LLELAKEYNRLDLELYSFAVNEIFPRQCERVGVGLEAHTHCRDAFRSELHPKFLLCQLYNMLVYRQLSKLRNKRLRALAEREAITPASAAAESNVR
jgi:hypothetical protein